jgi:leader peptidase (prepilin peptidase)/N-methyltransferase
MDSTATAVGVAVLSGVLGLLVGSFLNVVIYRVPLGKSIVSPGSACPRCGSPIKPYDNVPVVSWLLLRGKCRVCAEPISARYPLVELLTGLLFATIGVRFAPDLDASAASLVSQIVVLVAFLYLGGISVALAAIDLDTHKLPNVIVLPSYAIALVLFAAAALLGGDLFPLARAALGGVILYAAYFAMAFAYPAGMGFGDVKLAGVLGIYLGWLGWGSLAVGAFAAFLLGGLFSTGLIALRKAGRKSGIPFGPWMLAGALVGVFAGEQLWGSYLDLVGLA